MASRTTPKRWRPEHIIWVGDDQGLPEEGSRILVGSMVAVGSEDIAENHQIPPCFQDAERKRITNEAGPKWVYNGPKDSAHREIHQSIIIASEMGRIVGCAPSSQDYSDLKVDELRGLIRERRLGPPGKRKKQELVDTLNDIDRAALEDGAIPSVSYWPFDKLLACLDGTSADQIEHRTLFIFCWSGIPNMPRIHAVYQRLGELQEGRARCYPEFGDLHHSECKIGDIAALEYIAKKAISPAYQYRPQTCFKTEDCTLEGPAVIKRSHSAGGDNVHLNPTADRTERLRCQAGIRRRSPRVAPPPGENNRQAIASLPFSQERLRYMISAAPIWFHQGKVPSLIKFGEFRLIIVTIPDETGLRGIKGAVFEAFHTKPRDGRPEEPLVNVMNRVPHALLSAEHCGTRTYHNLESFALFIFEQLRQYGAREDVVEPTIPRAEAETEPDRPAKAAKDTPQATGTAENSTEPSPPPPDSSPLSSPATSPTDTPNATQQTDTYRTTMFDSLEVGVRMDIGISSAENGHRFFVNEITREWYGDLISFKTGEPRTRICCALAAARARFLFDVVEDEESEDGDETWNGFSDEIAGSEGGMGDGDGVEGVGGAGDQGGDAIVIGSDDIETTDTVSDSGILDIDRLRSTVQFTGQNTQDTETPVEPAVEE
ncbi:uncharacterized protein RCC_08772 [Ramularia collo-cygni]|uniref:SAP domain-containing protein n=1 Tax=Ramularia collo-cygni TaxID=112498 RepID=A0A2D3VDD9_9PEZI|nr:uncharacterized protein RCC_08772 [Ramularia collo-cygni]CZT23062.1 uncharacterized protein RCC_08772 [Ramularia collo-cygni]